MPERIVPQMTILTIPNRKVRLILIVAGRTRRHHGLAEWRM